MTKEAMKLALEAVLIGFKAERFMTDADYALQDKAVLVLQEALAEPTSADYAMGYAEGFNDACKPAQRQARSADTWVVPDALTAQDPETLEYILGWNDCRQLMMEMLRREIK